MVVYYRFQHEMPKIGEEAHCFTNKDHFIGFAQMMKRQDPDFKQMKFWEIQGDFVKPDDDDVVVIVRSARQIYLTI